MKRLAHYVLSVAFITTASSSFAQSEGVGRHDPPPNSPSVNQEPTRRPSYGDPGNIKADPHRNDGYSSDSNSSNSENSKE